MFTKTITNEDVAKLLEVLSKGHTTKITAIKTDVLLKSYHLSFSPRHLRAVVEHIRKNDLAAPSYIVSSTSNGYWLTSDTAEMRSFLNQELDRVSNQYGNIQPLHERLVTKRTEGLVKQLQIFGT